ncbi:MAG: alkene reductase [Verrucomicrobiales bacterium]|nr:alkene reductase [Verrucomicrobiales bacterium]
MKTLKKQDTEVLFRSFNLNGTPLKNRVVMAPMTRSRSGEDRVPKDIMAEYYAQRAGAGLIITEATTISEDANGWIQSPGIYTDEMEAGWKKIVDAVHEKDGRIFLQLWHTGRASHSDFRNGRPPVAPSPIPIEDGEAHTPDGKKPYETPRALETAEIPAIVGEYRIAAARARDAGFDGVEVHAANGYLLDTFLQSKTNHRTDEYGGSVEARYRMLDQVVRSVAEVIPENQIGVRIGPNGDFNDMGSGDFREQFTYVAKQLNQYDLAYLHVIDGLEFGSHGIGEPMQISEFREFFDKPLMGNCGYDREDGDEAISSGDADLIAYGRPYISNPDLAERFKSGWDLNPDADQDVFYAPIGEEGYTDFPTAGEAGMAY